MMSAAVVSSSHYCDFWDIPSKPHQLLASRSQLNLSDKLTMGGVSRLDNPSLTSTDALLNLTERNLSILSLLGGDTALQQLQATGHRRLDRSISEPADHLDSAGSSRSNSFSGVNGLQQSGSISPTGSSARYKTELCRPYEENGLCKYGDKCQFAHGHRELRSLSRHPKYKTEACRTYHTTGFCPYGPRCHFIHNSEEVRRLTAAQRLAPLSRETAAPRSLTNRPKALSFSFGSTCDMSPVNISESPTTVNGSYSDDPFGNNNFSPISTPLTPSSAQIGSAFSFGPQDFTSHNPPMKSCTTQQQQNAYNHALSQQYAAAAVVASTLNLYQQQEMARRALSDHSGFQQNVTSRNTSPVFIPNRGFETSCAGFEAPPSPIDSLTSNLDSLSLSSSPESSNSLGDLVNKGLRLPIFSRLATND